MKRILIVHHDAGGGHRNAAVALQTVISQQPRDWQVELVQFQELTDPLDALRKLTGIRTQQQYNILLQNGWTLGSKYLLRLLQGTIRAYHKPLVNFLEKCWRARPGDLLVSVIPHFNRAICESWTRVYFKDAVSGVTQMLDPATLAEFRKNVAAQNNRASSKFLKFLQPSWANYPRARGEV